MIVVVVVVVIMVMRDQGGGCRRERGESGLNFKHEIEAVGWCNCDQG